jgi:O-antigen/teichoic acid export membrane protein
MGKKSFKKNILYNSIYRCVVIITPLITSPYLARVLGAEKLGIYATANAFATYFVLIALLGVNDYGNRTVAQVREDRGRLSDCFWQIYYLQFFLTIVLSCIYLFSIRVFPRYFRIQLILGIYVVSSLFEINWFAYGMEQFKLTSIRSVVIRLLMVACIFLFVKGENDLWKYTLIIAAGNIVSLLVIVPLVFQYTDFRKPDFLEMKRHLRPDILLFLPIVATSVYQYLNKLMLGNWAVSAEVGFYQNAENIITLPSFLTTAIVTVMLPYSSNLVAKGDNDGNEQLLQSSVKYTSILNLAMAFGIFSIAGDFIPWYLGKGFERSAVLIKLMAPVIFLNGLSSVLRYQYIIPHELDKANLVSMFSGAGADILFNLLLIPRYGAVGAAVATVLAYLVILLVQLFYIRKDLNISDLTRSFLPCIVFGILMSMSVMLVGRLHLPILLLILLEIAVGATVFLACTFIWLEKSGDHVFHNIWSSLKSRIRR